MTDSLRFRYVAARTMFAVLSAFTPAAAQRPRPIRGASTRLGRRNGALRISPSESRGELGVRSLVRAQRHGRLHV